MAINYELQSLQMGLMRAGPATPFVSCRSTQSNIAITKPPGNGTGNYFVCETEFHDGVGARVEATARPNLSGTGAGAQGVVPGDWIIPRAPPATTRPAPRRCLGELGSSRYPGTSYHRRILGGALFSLFSSPADPKCAALAFRSHRPAVVRCSARFPVIFQLA